MLTQISKSKPLYQEQAAWDIMRKFGKQFVYDNENGNPAIEKSVLTAFEKISKEEIVWSRSERFWRLREPSDTNSRQQE